MRLRTALASCRVSLARYEGKVFSLLHSNFSEAFLLDCDNIPFQGATDLGPVVVEGACRLVWGALN